MLDDILWCWLPSATEGPMQAYEDETPTQPGISGLRPTIARAYPLLVGQDGREVCAIAPQHAIKPLA